MCDTLAMVTLQGQLPRPEAARFLASCFTDIKPELDCYVWDGWQDAVAALGLAELRPLVKQAFERGSVEPTWLSFEDFEEDMNAALECPEEPVWFVERFPALDDVVEEFSTWPSFKEGERERERLAAGAHRSLWDSHYDGPAINPFKDVGRNDPCPCGSGKTFKKCCLDAYREAPFQGEAA